MSDNVTFSNLGIGCDVLDAIHELGFKHPTEIQEKAIPALLNSDNDFIGQAQTGTGKTAAFVIPLLERIDPESRSVQALVLAPTRELAVQIEEEVKKLSKFTGVRSLCVYGGVGYDKQIKSLKKDFPHIVVGTPGRVVDHIKQGRLKLQQAQFCVLDEADEMLKMGFVDDVELVLESFNKQRQMIMFSATLPKQVMGLVQNYAQNYDLVKVAKKSVSNENVEQKYFVVKEKYFSEALTRLIDAEDDIYAMVFCRTKIETKKIYEDLQDRGHKVEYINGDLGQAERDFAMRRFKNRSVSIMVCTDVAARGIDVNNLTHVFNVGVPQNSETYVHRIGRTGRAGASGKAYSIVGPSKSSSMKRIEKQTKGTISLDKLPSIEVLKRKVVERELSYVHPLIATMFEKGEDYRVDASFEAFNEAMADLSKEELLKIFFNWKFARFIKGFNALPHLDASKTESRDAGRKQRARRFERRGERGSDSRGEKRGRGDRRERGEKSERPARKGGGRGKPKSGKPSSGAKGRGPRRKKR